ncbi:mitochondrial glycoprotein [Roridomyces roridus]|uniref:Mitochondrial glycoprotein n=1 Tax=Roridomyces roridus TaxID=1738132 RepID=A0AAD7BLU5_9AGAR|nr:mitochondrial glycoprotein [Roridomyces roridus]
MSDNQTTTDKICKYCRKTPRYTSPATGLYTSLYCSNTCAKKAGAPLPNPEGLVKRPKDLSLGELLIQEGEIERAKSNAEQPVAVDRLVRDGGWKLENVPGKASVLLTRKYQNEIIRVNFHMAEIDPFEPDDSSDEEDEDEDKKGAAGDAGGEDSDSDDDNWSEPVECTISIARPNRGALLFECFALPSNKLDVLKISYIKDEKLVQQDSGEAERQIREAGVGPEYDSLPKRIKQEFNTYLGERGIDDTLAHAVTDFLKYKALNEAQGWFDAVGRFVSGN